MENEKQNELFNYEEEHKNLGEGGFWKPEAGTYQVTALEDPVKYEQTFENDGKSETKARIKFLASVKDSKTNKIQETIYTANVVPTKDSHFGQLVRFGKSKGTLVGSPFTLIVNGAGIKKKYIIAEAAGLE